jgi:hypothetical protein
VKRPTEYKVTMILTPAGRGYDDQIQLKYELDNIPRARILATDYGVPQVTDMVRQFEGYFAWEDEAA